MRPWNQPTTLPSEIADAVRRQRVELLTDYLYGAISLLDLTFIVGKKLANIIGSELRPPIRVIHHEIPAAAELVPDRERCADSSACISGRRLHVNAPTRRHPTHLSVSDGVHRASACKGEVGEPGLSLNVAENMEKRLLVHRLH